MKIRIKEADQNNELLSQLKGQMGDLVHDIEDALEDKTKEQKEGVLTVASIAVAMPAILGLVARFGKAASLLVKKVVGQKPTEQGAADEWLDKMSSIADDLHHLYMAPLEGIMKKFIKDPAKAKKAAHFLFHVIVAVMFLASGFTAFKALKSKEISLATLETALAAVKGGEIKDYIAKIIS